MQTATALVGGTAAGSLLPASISAAVQPASSPTRTVVDTPQNAVVETKAGKVRGFTRNGVFVFKGIPYGDTTAGANRFMAPKPVPSWTGVRPALAWGPVSPHGPRAGWVNQEEQFLYQWDDGFVGEDMLRINVWTPAVNDAGRRPVLVWIHGGGYASGSSQELRPYDGARLAANHDVVLVSMNHRLNVFGFLDLSRVGGERYQASGNAGMLDLVQALEWVRDNVAAFGGDPGNVTIFGQSGGGGKVTTLMGMPAARGLFHKAAALSGSLLAVHTPESADKLASAVLAELGIGRGDLSALHTLPWERMLAAAMAAQQKVAPFAFPKPGVIPTLNLGWQPVADGRHLPESPFDPKPPAQSASIPFLLGNTFHEFATGIDKPDAHRTTLDQLREQLRPALGARTGDVIEAYRKAFPDAQPFEIGGLVGADMFRRGMILQADLKSAQNGAPVYVYWFGWKTPVLDGRPLAYHCQDLAFWFDNIDLAAQATGGGEGARQLADKMSRSLVAFARTGNPNHPGVPEWPPYTAAGGEMMIWNDSVSVQRDPDREARRILAEAAGG
jgi:para-nitrobenzyl esterase